MNFWTQEALAPGTTGMSISVTANSCTENVQISVLAVAAAVCGTNIESFVQNFSAV